MVIKYFNRLRRWFKCQHKWKVWLMCDPLNPISSGNIYAPEKLDPNKEKVKICSKCGEVRTFGRRINVLW